MSNILDAIGAAAIFALAYGLWIILPA